MSIYQILEAYSSKTRYFKIMSILNRYPRYPSNPAYFRKRILASQPQLRTGSSKISQKKSVLRVDFTDFAYKCSITISLNPITLKIEKLISFFTLSECKMLYHDPISSSTIFLILITCLLEIVLK